MWVSLFQILTRTLLTQIHMNTMRKSLAAAVCLMAILQMGLAQQALWGGGDLQSPEINEDKSVTFRINAPQAASVQLSGDWMPMNGWTPGTVEMAKGEKGTWSYTTDPLNSELYSYFFVVDGLRMKDPSNPFLVRDIATVTNIFIIDGGPGDLYAVQDVPHGAVTQQWYDSPGIGMDRRITIYTPPGYETSAQQYPVLYLLHGAGGDEEAWITLGRATQIMDNLLAQGKAEPMIVVMPNGNVIQDAAPGEGSMGFYKPQFMVPRTMDGTYETAFTDIISFVESHYRVKTGKAHRAIAGLSMGGFHSLHISRYYPDTFDYVGLFSAAIMPRDGVESEVYQNIDETLSSQRDNGYRLYWIAIGKTDFLYEAVQRYMKRLDGMDMEYTYRESEGGHTWKNWRVYLTEFVPLLFR